ncbi:hypothetical protein DAPPUDRAFT_236433 [Daphnia pulex]|uniref:HMG box domain-containing protein n=1 Tax=Daphnia pulex TaxID=6669 RepID=E9G1Z5_DAPPU|nr:hypothetical protein DAPPUDRAFT_236433 [Daphnia pulex]|eukprot:EFX86576.1 hypothetical protein DAPPUDRAFT_236433 [Daphnia pulex]
MAAAKGKPKKSVEPARSALTVPPLQIRIPKNVNPPPIALKAETYEDDASTDGDSDEFSNSMDKEELETYHDDSNSQLDDYEQDDSLMKHGDKMKHQGNNSNFMKGMAEMEEDDSDDHIDPETNSDSEADVDVAGPSDPPNFMGNTKQPSLYLLENAKKKIVLKDGKLVAARQKAQRKDKGKTRFTAYMLWSKEMRPVVSRQNPDLKFEQVSKRLGELWATVSQAERMTWKRRAMRQGTKSSGGMISTGVKPQPVSRVKPTVSPKRVFADLCCKHFLLLGARGTVKPLSPAKQRQRFTSSDGFDNVTIAENDSSTLGSPPSVVQPRAHELEPLDVATHLHLLGESLSVIGSRLKEQNGQIAVSGSLSVLLDSVVCALGPLLCLTRLTPETNGCPPETLSRILDNIAYIMPGL